MIDKPAKDRVGYNAKDNLIILSSFDFEWWGKKQIIMIMLEQIKTVLKA